MIPCGKLLRVQVLVDDEYVYIEGERTSNGAISKNYVDVTDKNHQGWREGSRCGILSSVITFEGLVTDGPVQKLVQADAVFKRVVQVKFSDPLYEWTGPFLISSLERQGVYNDAEVISISFESAGLMSVASLLNALQVSQDGSFLRVSQDGSYIQVSA